MYNVEFPGIGLKFRINPVAFTIGEIEIRWYGILIAVGFLVAFFYVISQCKQFNINSDHITDAILVGLITGIIGARLYYVIFYPGDTYIKDPLSIFKISEGGIAIYGGIIGGLMGGVFIANKRSIPLFRALDVVSIGFLIGQSIGRWGNFTNQEAFGTQTNNLFRMVSESTNGLAVHPCFLYESFWCFIGVIFLHIFNKKIKKFDGQTFLLYLIWYGIERFFVEALRTDSLIIPVLSLRVSQVIAIFAVVIGSVLLVYFTKINKRREILGENN